MTTSNIKESDLVDYGDAAAGHFGLLTDASGAFVVKPCSDAEVAFYEACALRHPDFAALIPTFMGNLSLATAEQQTELAKPNRSSLGAALRASATSPEELLRKGQEAAAKAEAHGKKLDTAQAIVLENVAAGFVKPNILDVKLGGRLWADDAPPTKRARLDKVSGETTSGSLGFRIAGMRIWKDAKFEYASQVDGQGSSIAAQGAYQVFDKQYGRSLSASNVREAFELFFRGNDAATKLSPERQAVLELCEQYLQPIESILASEESRMYSASVLVVTEGDDEALGQAFAKMESLQKKEEASPISEAEAEADIVEVESDEAAALDKLPKICAVKLIDFAHARWTPGEGPDENMLQGVRSIKRILETMLNGQ